MRGTPAERYRAKFIQRGPNECWPWTGALNDKGYGNLGIAGKIVLAHRFGWTLHYGPIPVGPGYHGICVLHSCDTPPCQNPAHWFLGTHQDNMADRDAKGRGARPSFVPPPRRGSANEKSKLTEEQVLTLRALYADSGWTQTRLAQRYGIHQTVVSDIVRRRTWRYV